MRPCDVEADVGHSDSRPPGTHVCRRDLKFRGGEQPRLHARPPRGPHEDVCTSKRDPRPVDDEDEGTHLARGRSDDHRRAALMAKPALELRPHNDRHESIGGRRLNVRRLLMSERADRERPRLPQPKDQGADSLDRPSRLIQLRFGWPMIGIQAVGNRQWQSGGGDAGARTQPAEFRGRSASAISQSLVSNPRLVGAESSGSVKRRRLQSAFRPGQWVGVEGSGLDRRDREDNAPSRIFLGGCLVLAARESQLGVDKCRRRRVGLNHGCDCARDPCAAGKTAKALQHERNETKNLTCHLRCALSVALMRLVSVVGCLITQPMNVPDLGDQALVHARGQRGVLKPGFIGLFRLRRSRRVRSQ